MNRIPPNLLYLTIYNPTLRPTGPVDDDNEDAEEQAHILFYTSKERAVSRDRMLRQIGLAKALVNFAECGKLVNLQVSDLSMPCIIQVVQSRRSMRQCPFSIQEDDYGVSGAQLLDTCGGFPSQVTGVELLLIWMQGIEVARLPRVADPKSKSKIKGKPSDAGKEKETAPVYDYEDGSVHDAALRAHILMGYERFKVREIWLFNSCCILFHTIVADPWVLHLYSGDSRTTGPRTSVGKILDCLGMVLGLGR